jgi:hypothetical protein
MVDTLNRQLRAQAQQRQPGDDSTSLRRQLDALAAIAATATTPAAVEEQIDADKNAETVAAAATETPLVG